MKKYGEYYVTIGLEIHVALKTEKKLFSATLNSFNVDEFDLFDIGTPGVLPILNKEPVDMAIAFGLATNSKINYYSEFERKHYFYPDLPLGYQITQQNKPILIGGEVEIKVGDDKYQIKIEHSHLECDAAKSIHGSEYTEIDVSRCASPLLEIVSTPCMHSPEEAKEYAKSIHSLVTFLNICDGKMEEGSFRVDASISLSKEMGKLGTRVEIKNISSFSFLESALNYEIFRQSELLNENEKIVMETRLYNESNNTTQSMREKETVDEYRYLPDPDIIPLVIEQFDIDNIKDNYEINYYEIKNKLISILNIDESIILTLMNTDFNICKNIIEKNIDSDRLKKLICFWYLDCILKSSTKIRLDFETLVKLTNTKFEAKEIKEIINGYILNTSVNKKIEDFYPNYMNEDDSLKLINNIIRQYPEQIEKLKNGEDKIIQFLIGKVMSELKGKIPANKIKEIIVELVK